jgi:hypothetical protein
MLQQLLQDFNSLQEEYEVGLLDAGAAGGWGCWRLGLLEAGAGAGAGAGGWGAAVPTLVHRLWRCSPGSRQHCAMC